MESEIAVNVSWSKLILSASIGAMVAGIGYLFFKTYHRRRYNTSKEPFKMP